MVAIEPSDALLLLRPFISIKMRIESPLDAHDRVFFGASRFATDDLGCANK